MKIIPQTRHSHYISYLRFYLYFTMSVPDEGYSTNTSFALHYIPSFLFLFYYERTWWRLFQKVLTKLDIYIVISLQNIFLYVIATRFTRMVVGGAGGSYNELTDEGPHPMDTC